MGVPGRSDDQPAWFSPAQMQALNPALVMLIIPLNNFVIDPAMRQ